MYEPGSEGTSVPANVDWAACTQRHTHVHAQMHTQSTHMHTYSCTQRNTCMHMCTHSYRETRAHIHMHMCAQTHIHRSTCMYTQMHSQMHTCMHTSMYCIQAHTYIWIDAQTHTDLCTHTDTHAHTDAHNKCTCALTQVHTDAQCVHTHYTQTRYSSHISTLYSVCVHDTKLLITNYVVLP